MVFTKIKKILFTGLLIVFPFISASSQSYRYEIGGMLGTSVYLGEANHSMFGNVRESFGALFRYNHSFRYAVKMNLAIAGIAGDTRDYPNVFPDHAEVNFSRNLFDLGAQIEFNFFNYSDGFRYLETKNWSPYISAGLGMLFSPSPGDTGSIFGMSVPFGVGIKYKIKPRWNVGFEFSFRKTFSDNLDVVNKSDFSLDDPYGINSSAFKNKDWYNFTFLFITYDFYECGGFCK